MSKPARRARGDHWIRNALLTASVVLLVGFAAVWAYLQYAEHQRLSSTYTSLKPVAISRGGHSIAATFAVKTSEADARWAAQNRVGLEAALQQTLLAVDPQRVLAPNGLRQLQQSLHGSVNSTLGTDKVQEIVITDFLVSEGDF